MGNAAARHTKVFPLANFCMYKYHSNSKNGLYISVIYTLAVKARHYSRTKMIELEIINFLKLFPILSSTQNAGHISTLDGHGYGLKQVVS